MIIPLLQFNDVYETYHNILAKGIISLKDFRNHENKLASNNVDFFQMDILVDDDETSTNELIDLFNAGFKSAFVNTTSLDTLLASSSTTTPEWSSRLHVVLELNDVKKHVLKEEPKPTPDSHLSSRKAITNGIKFTTLEDLSHDVEMLSCFKSLHDLTDIQLVFCPEFYGNGVELRERIDAITMCHRAGLDVIVETPLLAPEFLGDALFSCLSSDRDDLLVPTVVVNESHQCLGLAYSSRESIIECLRTRRGVYQSRKRGLWHKGETSGSHQDLCGIQVDCDDDTLCFIVRQHGTGFCHKGTSSCFGEASGLTRLLQTLNSRLHDAPSGSYTSRLFNNNDLLNSKIMEEAKELAEAKTKQDVAHEAADLLYFALAKCVRDGVSLQDVERILDNRSKKVTRRPGNAKELLLSDLPMLRCGSEPFSLKVYNHSDMTEPQLSMLHKRPLLKSNDSVAAIVKPIIENVKKNGDVALIELTKRFDKVDLAAPTLDVKEMPTPSLPEDLKNAIDLAYDNILKFHKRQLNDAMMTVETSKEVFCSRTVRSIEKVGLYIPGGTAVLFSTALMLGIPAVVAGCKDIIYATPPCRDGTVSPEILYVAKRIGASKILLAGGAQAIAALAYGTQSVPKVDKICGPGNEFVTVAKMLVQQDSSSPVAIDMPAGPTELMVLADNSANPRYVAADLLSQAEHGPQSQVVLVLVNGTVDVLDAILLEVRSQAEQLPRSSIVRQSLTNSFVLLCDSIDDAVDFANCYAAEHLIVNTKDAKALLPRIQNAGSVFLGPYSTESCGDYAAGCNHTLPTYGYARMYSGVTVESFQKYVFVLEMNEEGLKNIGPSVEIMAEREGLHAHKNAVSVRLADI